MKWLNKFCEFLGIEKKTPYIRSYIAASNAHSALYLSIVIMLLEVWMLFGIIYLQFFSGNPRSSLWLWQHIPCYLALFTSSLVMHLYAVLFKRGKKLSYTTGKVIYVAFSIVGILFGIYISYLDYAKGEQFVTLLTMTLFIFCFLQWRPIYTFLFLTFSYLFFYFLCGTIAPASYATKVNLIIAWISLSMGAANSYHQKIKEAKKGERLEQANEILMRLSISDEITGLSNMNYFLSQTLMQFHDKKTDIKKMIFLFLDVEHFKNYNEKHGFLEGNEFLRKLAEKLKDVFAGSITAHFSNDNFVIFTEDIDIQKKLAEINEYVTGTEEDLSMCLKTGAYRPKDRDSLPIVACDHARYACYSIKKHFDRNYCEYSEDMDKDFYRKQYIINNIDKAIGKEYLKVYYQPLVNAKTGELCGLEALARWDDPEHGFLMPGLFISTLEEYHQIHKLDMYMLNRVCLDLVEAQERNYCILPVSLNFSRLDFEVLDLASEVEETLSRYKVDKKYIHVEITESALAENDTRLQNALNVFRKSGYALWLDDFGSGYSGLNVLKEYDFDVMKIDMKFLHNFEGDEKSKTILKNIVTLAKDIGMVTLTEGVETEEAKQFLQKIGCETLQGYLFGTPMTIEDLRKKITSGEYKIEKM